jgi:hypothetical protein
VDTANDNTDAPKQGTDELQIIVLLQKYISNHKIGKTTGVDSHLLPADQ